MAMALSKPRSIGCKLHLSNQWSTAAGFDFSAWVVGFAFDNAPYWLRVNIGPLFAGIEQHGSSMKSYDELWNFGWTLWHLVIPQWKLEVRFDVDLNIWRLGYMMADRHDHGIYVGPINIQIENDKFYSYPTIRT
jgi:hypothetical protein